MKVALLQAGTSEFDQAANQSKGHEYCRRAKEQGADIALLPEMWNIGYTPFDPAVFTPDYDPFDPKYQEAKERWREHAIDQNSDFFTSYQELATELNMAIVLTYLEKIDGPSRNSAALIDRTGKVVLTYSKVHTCDFSMEDACTPGSEFPVVALDTSQGPVMMGIMICYDREFPETARILMLNGAEIILCPNACTLEQNRLTQFRTRAYENMVGVAMTNYPAPTYNGASCAFSPIAFNDKGESQDILIVQADDQEGIWIADFDLEAIRKYRAKLVWGNAYRKPSAYSKLVDPEVLEPFIRKDARR